MRGTTSTRTQVMLDDRVPVPTRLIVTVLGLVQPDASVVLPLSPCATATMVAAGVVPVPVHVNVSVRWLLSTMLKPVTVTFAMVLAALKPVKDPLGSVASGPGPLVPSHWFVLKLFVVVGLSLFAETLANAKAAAPALSPAMMMSSTTVRVATPLLTVG